ncbi:glycosyltransferase family 2 protein [Chamaesiphon sp. VAR_69_metabat_338]|uniref:glycosyltransferase family 2 protein n=1 Tax=Chamaesiphon sp. VAR_69_metabat_338 TaxID=2964704 RepID=UPI00286E7D19|nr:glycosyltransferase family 2 protein [Chamaesiphon sp. VAR_69_metabat_338]
MTHSLKSPTVSVVIPTYNRAGVIGKPIRSVLAQSYQDFEIIVVDDCSNDDTERVLESFNDPRIRYIRHQSNSGAAVARNTGIDNSTGAYIAFLDSDDEWLPEKLAKQLNLFQQCSSEVGFIYTGFAAVDEGDRVKRIVSSHHRGSLSDRLLYSNFIGTPSTVMVKRKYLQQVRGFDPNMPSFIEDMDLWLRLSEHCQFEVIPEVLTRYAYSDAGDRLTLNHKSVVEGTLAFIHKHHHHDTFNSTSKETGLSNRDRAEYLFEMGRTLICSGLLISHSEAIQVGRRYHLLSFKTNLLSFKPLFYYATSLLGKDAYFNLLKSENTIRSQLKQILKKEQEIVTQ